MSSPKRVAKQAIRRAANVASRARTAPAKPQIKAATGIGADAKRVAAAIERGIAAGRLDIVSADTLQATIAAACRLYAARRESGEDLDPVRRNSVSATDAIVTASGLLRAADLSPFELGVWQGWTGR
jgi:hypothetical protein